MIQELKKVTPDCVKKTVRRVENIVKYPYRSVRAQVLRRQIRLDRGSANYVAHRGLSAMAPENTVPAFRLAAGLGFDSMETDIRRTRDHKLVLMHDASLKRMCGVDLRVKDLTYEELSAIPVTGGNRLAEELSDTETIRVPLLAEFLEICRDGGIVPMLELKDNWNAKEPLPDDYLKDVIMQITEILEGKPVIFVSFNLGTLIRMKQLLGEAQAGQVDLYHLVKKIDLSKLSWYKEHGIHLSVKGADNRLAAIRKVREAGIRTVIWVVDDPDQARLYIRTKVDWIASNGKLWEN